MSSTQPPSWVLSFHGLSSRGSNMDKPRWKMVEVVENNEEVPREIPLVPARFFRKALDKLLPKGAVVLRASGGFALDLLDTGRREPFIVDPLPWHDFLAAIAPRPQ